MIFSAKGPHHFSLAPACHMHFFILTVFFQPDQHFQIYSTLLSSFCCFVHVCHVCHSPTYSLLICALNLLFIFVAHVLTFSVVVCSLYIMNPLHFHPPSPPTPNTHTVHIRETILIRYCIYDIRLIIPHLSYSFVYHLPCLSACMPICQPCLSAYYYYYYFICCCGLFIRCCLD